MKRRDLERRLRVAGCYLKREGANHSIWTNPHNGLTEAVPRHNEVKGALGTKNPEAPECCMNPVLAALCLEHGAEVLLTADRDFSRFAGLNVENPLLDARE